MDNYIALASIAQLIITAAIGGYFTWRAKREESRAQQILAESQAETASTNMQITIAQAAESLIAPLTEQIARQEKRIKQQSAELDLVREQARKQAAQLEKLTHKLGDMERERLASDERIRQLTAELAKERAKVAALRRELSKFERQVKQTGMLDGGAEAE